MNNLEIVLVAMILILLFCLIGFFVYYVIWSNSKKKKIVRIKTRNMIKKDGFRIDYFKNKNNQILSIPNNVASTAPISLENKKMEAELNEFKKKLNLQKIKMLADFEKELAAEKGDKAIYMMINAMESHVEDIVSNKFSFTIKLSDETIKGKIIGKDGRNKRHFEQTTKTDLIIEPNMAAITISSPNPIRREKAKQTMEKLLERKNIDINKISIVYEEVEKNFEKKCYEIGKNALENKLNIFDVNKNLYPIVGKLNFRTSYTQNVLLHCIECAVLAAQLAKMLKINSTKAKKAAFFHDIGKAIDFEVDNDHVNSGVQIAKQYHLEDYVINAIESHHNKVLPSTPYAALVKVVDKLSASRPGARIVSNDDYFKRIYELEKICKEFKGVQEAYVIKSGREIEIIVDASMLSDDDCKVLLQDIKFGLEENELVNKQPIQLTLVRSFVQKTVTSGSAKRNLN
ncbi:MAG: HDIG domain-containing protein [Malacoplasma sp.]|nr:HDIG domain-containing protein [Malacoplasma sp.]